MVLDIEKYRKKIEKLSYPYLKDFSSIGNLHEKRLLINQINEIARYAYVERSESDTTMPIEILEERIIMDPHSWLFCSNKGKIRGYAHVEIIDIKQLEALQKGALDENDFEPVDIDHKGEKIIHIGSVVNESFPSLFTDQTPLILLAGVIDRVFNISTLDLKITKVLACDFEDYKGDRHFRELLPEFGFVELCENNYGDKFSMLNLRDVDTKFHYLTSQVIASQMNYLEREKLTDKFKILANKLVEMGIVYIDKKNQPSSIDQVNKDD